MTNDTAQKRFLAVGAVAGLVAGLAGGYLAAHMTMAKMAGTGDMATMEGMPGMAEKQAPPGAVVVPAVMRQLIGVRSAPVGYAPLEQDIRAVGLVEYDQRKLTQVTLRVSGWIRDVFVNSVGRPVRRGEPLFTIYSPDLLATQEEYLLAVNAKAQLAVSPLADAKEQAAALVASARERLRLWDVTEAQIAALEQQGKAEPVLTIYAAASGIVLTREALPGAYVEPTTTLYELADLSTVWVYADIYESEVAAVKLNQPADVTFEAYPGEIFRGKTTYIYPSLNEATRTVRVRVELSNAQLKLKPGMYGNVTLRTDVVKTLVVPKEAVLDTGLRQLVFLDQGEGIYQPYPVKVGRRSQDYVEVLEGIKDGDRVVTSANFLLDAESKLASTGSMQDMMGLVGMGGWQMRGAHEAKMEGMPGMPGMKTMDGMKAKPVAETRQAGGLTFTLTTMPETPKAGETVLRLKVTDQAGKPATNAQVAFSYTMPMPGMMAAKVTGTHSKNGVYEGKAMLGMGGMWEVTANVTVAGQPPISETFQFVVGGM